MDENQYRDDPDHHPAAEDRVQTPVDLFSHLPSSQPDPLPPPYRGTVYHYTSAAVTISIVQNDELWGSHVSTMNDSAERLYGWQCVVERLGVTHGDYDERFVESVIGFSINSRHLPNAYVVSASKVPNDLAQFRGYGSYEVGLRSGHWFVEDHPDAPLNPLCWTVWRPVLYGPDDARDYIDRMLSAVNGLFTQSGVDLARCVQWIDYLACLIKDPGFRAEQEVRLLFHTRVDELYRQHRTSGRNIVPYIIFRPGVSGVGCITSLRLGPQAASDVAILGAKSLLQKSGDYRDLKVETSLTPYRG